MNESKNMNTSLSKVLPRSALPFLIGIASNLLAADLSPLLLPAAASTSFLGRVSGSEAGSTPVERFSFGADAGLSLQQNLTLRGEVPGLMTFDPGLRLDMELRYGLSDRWAVAFQTGLIYNTIDTIAGVPLGSIGFNASLSEIPVMANLSYTIPTHGPFSIYLGGGVGGVF